jgi:hypothetical protein
MKQEADRLTAFVPRFERSEGAHCVLHVPVLGSAGVNIV